VGAADSMEFESILVSKALPDGTFSQKAVFDTHRTITSSKICVILPPAPSALQEGRSTLASIHAKASAAKRLRSNGLVGDLWEAKSTPSAWSANLLLGLTVIFPEQSPTTALQNSRDRFRRRVQYHTTFRRRRQFNYAYTPQSNQVLPSRRCHKPDARDDLIRRQSGKERGF
jgi:hypothetical protein